MITIWFDKSDAARPWLVRKATGETVRARHVEILGSGSEEQETLASTAFRDEGFAELQPGGPRGIINCGAVRLSDEASA